MSLPPFSVSIHPGTHGFWSQVTDSESPTEILHESDSFTERQYALEAAELWIDRRMDEERERRREREDKDAQYVPSEGSIAQSNGVGSFRSRL